MDDRLGAIRLSARSGQRLRYVPFTGNYADPARKPVSCFAFAHYQGTVVARGGFTGPPGYAASYSGGYCEANSQKLSDAYIAHIVGMLELPQE